MPIPEPVATERTVPLAPVRVACSANPPLACVDCGRTKFTADGYCRSCGLRRPAGRPHAEADLGPAAAVSDIGNRHRRNEDGFALAAVGPAYAGVVCDGVSSSDRADTAAHAAAEAAVRALTRTLATGHAGPPDADLAAQAIHVAAAAAQAAAVGAAGAAAEAAAGSAAGSAARSAMPANPPSTTFVCAVVAPEAAVVGWVGDSRAYWLGEDGSAECLTVDDTLAGRFAAAHLDVAANLPNATALIRWLGADSTDAQPHVATVAPGCRGTIIVCSDGLHRYASTAQAMSMAVRAHAAVTPIETVRALVGFALDAGGIDNVTVIALPYPPSG